MGLSNSFRAALLTLALLLLSTVAFAQQTVPDVALSSQGGAQQTSAKPSKGATVSNGDFSKTSGKPGVLLDFTNEEDPVLGGPMPSGKPGQLIDFADKPAIILGGPNTGIPSDQGDCIGNGCSSGEGLCVGTGCAQTANGNAVGINDVGGPTEANQFPASSNSPSTRFQDGTLDFGSSWANGGFLGGSVFEFTPSKYGDPVSVREQALAVAPLMVTPDAYFPREQVFVDLTLLSNSVLAVNSKLVIRKVPQVAPILPASSQQFTDLAASLFDRFYGPMIAEGKIHTDWDWYRRELSNEMVPNLMNTAAARDFGLASYYLDVTGSLVNQLQSAVTRQANDLLAQSVATEDVGSALHEDLESLTETIKQAITDETTFFRSPIPALPAVDSATRLGERQAILEDSYSRVQPITPQQDNARIIGNEAVKTAKQYLSAGQLGEAAVAQQIAFSFLDIAISLTPVLGPARDGYEFFTGKNLLTGEYISQEQRVISGLAFATGLATFGISSAAALRTLEELEAPLYKTLGKGTLQEVKPVLPEVRPYGYPKFSMSKFDVPMDIERIETGAEANRRSMDRIGKSYSGQPYRANPAQPPWDDSVLVVKGVTKAPVPAVRLGVSDSIGGGRFCTLKEDVVGLSRSQLQSKFNLLSPPEYMIEFNIPSEEDIVIGAAGPNRFGGSTGARQIEIVNRPLSDKWVTKSPVRLP